MSARFNASGVEISGFGAPLRTAMPTLLVAARFLESRRQVFHHALQGDRCEPLDLSCARSCRHAAERQSDGAEYNSNRCIFHRIPRFLFVGERRASFSAARRHMKPELYL